MSTLKNRSQAFQEYFAQQVCVTNGTYIEVGAHYPKKLSNTYNLECFHGWKGFSIEYNVLFKDSWSKTKERKNKIFWEDALTFDYKQAAIDLGLGTHFNYLSCDIEPPSNTYDALVRIIEQGLTFDCITFEHDLYQSDVDYNDIVTKYLLSKNYKLAVTEVYYIEPKNHFETWFVSNQIDFETTTFEQWKKASGL